MYEYSRAVVGGTLAGARKIIDGEARVAMVSCLECKMEILQQKMKILCLKNDGFVRQHFNGGRHHAKPDRADGFCYVNDICIAIFELLVLPSGRVLYVLYANANAVCFVYTCRRLIDLSALYIHAGD